MIHPRWMRTRAFPATPRHVEGARDREGGEVYKWKRNDVGETWRDEKRRGWLDGNIYIRWAREAGIYTPVIYVYGNYASADGWERGCTRAARSRRRLCIHIQIELYALPDALIRNHSTAWHLQNKLVSHPSAPVSRPSATLRVSFYSAGLSSPPSRLMEILGEKLVKRIRFAYVSKRLLLYHLVQLTRAIFWCKHRFCRI